MKFGRIKRQHGRVKGLDELLTLIVKQCTLVSRIVPGRISVRRGTGRCSLKIQYDTGAGLKCLFSAPGTVQEVFLICTDVPGVRLWLADSGLLGDES